MARRKNIFFITLICAILLVNICIHSCRVNQETNVYNYSPTEKIPLLMLGVFRGVAVDFLWTRAIVRYEEKKYYELLTINKLISKLQPDFPAVWIFQAWNMAYNIAHEWDAPQNKWKWIHAGLDFAKNGAAKNPTSGDLFFELGYMYLHLFDYKVFKYANYYRERLKSEDKEDNYEMALYWLRKSLLNRPRFHNVLAIERTICHTLLCASLNAEREGDINEALEYVESAINEWKIYSVKHAEDGTVSVGEFLDTLERRRLWLQNLLGMK